MLSYTPSETFYADQGLPSTTEVDLAHETDFMYEFIELFVGESISLWDLYNEYIKNPSRQFEARLTIGNQVFDDDNIIEITLDETVNPDSNITLGSVASSKLDITVYDIPGTNYTNATVTAEIGLKIDNDIAYLPIGVFTVDEVDKNKNQIDLTCFDNMHKLEKPYVSSLSYPASLNQVALEIVQKAGVTLATNLPNTFIPEIKGYTLRQAIGFIASFVGGFAKFNRDGDLEIISYRETDEMITADNYIDLQTPESEFVVGQITCKVSNDDGDYELVSGVGGTGIYFENPIMTQEQLDAIFDDLGLLSYMPFEMRWQGNPLLLAGDKVTITDINDQIYSTLVMDQQLRYTGGLISTISAKGESETAQDFDFKGSLAEKVERIENRQTERDPNITPQQPSSITATGLFENILVEWTFENAHYIDRYEVYASQINNFVPSEANLVWRGKSGAFNYYANVNETWHFRVRGVNSHGVAGPYSDQATATTAQILSKDIMFGAVTSDLLADLSVEADKLAEQAVTSEKIANLAVGTAAIADAAIARAHLQEAIIENVHIADATIEAAKIKSLNADDIEAGTIRGIEIIGSTIVSYNSADNSIVSLENGMIESFDNGNLTISMGRRTLSFYNSRTDKVAEFFPTQAVGNESVRGLTLNVLQQRFSISTYNQGYYRSVFQVDTEDDYTSVSGPFNDALSGAGLYLYANRRIASSDIEYVANPNSTDQPAIVLDQGSGRNNVYQYFGGLNRRSGATWSVRYNDSQTTYQNRIVAHDSGVRLYGEITTDNQIYNSAEGASGGIRFGGLNIIGVRPSGAVGSGRQLVLYPNRAGSDGESVFSIRSHSNQSSYRDDVRVHANGDLAITERVKSVGGFILSTVSNSYDNSNDRFLMQYQSSRDTTMFTNSVADGWVARLTFEDRFRSGVHLWDRIRSAGTVESTTTHSANLYIFESNQRMSMVTSARKYKLAEQSVNVNPYDLINKVIPKDWFDKTEIEEYAEQLTLKHEGKDYDLDNIDMTRIRRIPGLVAEDVHDAGLGLFVDYDSNGNIMGIKYDRLWTLLIPITKDHEDDIKELKNKVSSLEAEIESLKGAI